MIIVMLKESPRLDDVRAVASLGLGFGLSLARQYRARFSGFAEAETNPGRARPGCSVLTDEVVAPGRVAINPNRISGRAPCERACRDGHGEVGRLRGAEPAVPC